MDTVIMQMYRESYSYVYSYVAIWGFGAYYLTTNKPSRKFSITILTKLCDLHTKLEHIVNAFPF